MTINIASTDSRFCRLLYLELSRMGIYAEVTDAPLESAELCLIDADTCPPTPPASGTTIIVFGNSTDGKTYAHGHLPKPFLLADFRRMITSFLVTKELPIIEPYSRKDDRGHLAIDHNNQTATVGNGEPIALSDTEYRLLCRLVEFGERPLSVGDVQDILGNTPSNTFNVYICYLRRKLERGNLRLIHTVRGQGYTLIPQERKK